MNSLARYLSEPVASVHSSLPASISLPNGNGTCESLHDQQLQALVQQVYLEREPRVRHVGFAALETGASVGPLCMQVASSLSQWGLKKVGLIDAQLRSGSLSSQLHLPVENETEPCSLRPNLWCVSPGNWLASSCLQVWDSSLTRLRTTAMEFDCSVVCLDPISWLTARISQICDGLVLVITASRTRRLVAAQVRDQLKKARVTLLGTVLAERQLPVPEGLYRNL